MARIAVLGSLSTASEVLVPLQQVSGHSIYLSELHPGEHVHADVLLMDEIAFKAYNSGSAEERTLIVVATQDPSTSTALLDQGAQAVVALPINSAEITSAIFALISADRYLSPRVIAARTVRPPSDNIVPSKLSPRELEVLTQLADGQSDASIAKELYLTKATVHTHILNLRRKLGARNRTHAVVLAIQYGLIPPHS